MSITKNLKAFTLLFIFCACSIEDDTSTTTAHDAHDRSLLEAKEDARLAMESLVECDTASSESCDTETEVLFEALQRVDDFQGDEAFRSLCYAYCPDGSGVGCDGYYCAASDGWGCVSYNAGGWVQYENLCPYCGDGWCGPGESQWNCPSDCNPCGDGWCGPGENQWNCPSDCHCGGKYCPVEPL